MTLSVSSVARPWGNNMGINVSSAAATLTVQGTMALLTWNYDYDFNKNGAGALALNGSYDCGGITQVRAGTLLINADTYDLYDGGYFGGGIQYLVPRPARLHRLFRRDARRHGDHLAGRRQGGDG
jgi:autotransporter-associated beta strand protein